MSLFAAFATVAPTLWVLVLTVAACSLLFRGRQFVKGTTLVGPWWWMQGSLFVMGSTQLVVVFANSGSAEEPASWETAVLFAAAASSFCPLMSLLGAKRPQDRGWHFVVLSLWAILVLPVAESLVLRHGQMPDVRGARSWFMLILIGLGIINSLPTRFWFPAILYGGGQLLMLANSLPFVREVVDTSPTIIGFSCCALSSIVATQFADCKRKSRGSLDSVWRDFRDAFGLLWGLRVAEQINIAARSSNWPLTLRWRGFVDDQGQTLEFSSLPTESRKPLRHVVDNQLRRFVSPEWIAARMGDPIDEC
ncbi:MAG: hypothetical protein ABI614_04655 [Planctomycetota bacterium]